MIMRMRMTMTMTFSFSFSFAFLVDSCFIFCLFIYFFLHNINMSYYWCNRQEILQKAKGRRSK